jgi:hypothetical protein
MIVLNPRATFAAPVQITVAGRADPAQAQFRFRVLENAQYLRLLLAMGFGKAGWAERFKARLALCWQLRRLITLPDLLAEVIESWEGFDQPYSRAALEQLLRTFPGVGLNILLAYVEHRQEARIKN